MKTDYLVLGLAGLACWFIVKGKGAGQGAASGAANTTWAASAAPDYAGWQYFTDGTSIGPDGSYYHNGVKVWAPSA